MHVDLPGPDSGLCGADRLQSDDREPAGAEWVQGAGSASLRVPTPGQRGGQDKTAAAKDQGLGGTVARRVGGLVNCACACLYVCVSLYRGWRYVHVQGKCGETLCCYE